MAALAANAVKQKRKREQHLQREQTVASLLLPGTSALVVGWSKNVILIDDNSLINISKLNIPIVRRCLCYSIGAGGTNASSLAIDSPTKGKYILLSY